MLGSRSASSGRKDRPCSSTATTVVAASARIAAPEVFMQIPSPHGASIGAQRNRQVPTVHGSLMAVTAQLQVCCSDTRTRAISPRRQARQGKQNADGVLGALGVLARANGLCASIPADTPS